MFMKQLKFTHTNAVNAQEQRHIPRKNDDKFLLLIIIKDIYLIVYCILCQTVEAHLTQFMIIGSKHMDGLSIDESIDQPNDY